MPSNNGMFVAYSQSANITAARALTALEMRDLMVIDLAAADSVINLPQASKFIGSFGPSRVTFINSGAFKATILPFAGDAFFGTTTAAIQLPAGQEDSVTLQVLANGTTWAMISFY